MVLASAGGDLQTGRKSVLDVALAATVAGNAAGAIYLYEMILCKKKFASTVLQALPLILHCM